MLQRMKSDSSAPGQIYKSFINYVVDEIRYLVHHSLSIHTLNSDKIVLIARAVGNTMDYFKTQSKTRTWMATYYHTPHYVPSGKGNKKPPIIAMPEFGKHADGNIPVLEPRTRSKVIWLPRLK